MCADKWNYAETGNVLADFLTRLVRDLLSGLLTIINHIYFHTNYL